MKMLTSLIAVTLLASGAASAQDEQVEQVEQDVKSSEQVIEERYGHLEKGKSGFRETWINPNTDWTKFDKLYLWDAEFQYRDVGPARRFRSTMMNSRQREFGIAEEDRLKFEEVVAEAFVEEIQRAKNFAVVDVIGPNTLIMRGAVLDIISRVPPEAVGRVDVYLASMGEATLVLELIDAMDGEVVAIVAERRAFQSGSRTIDEFSSRVTSVTVIAEVRRWARREASKLRSELQKAIAGK